MSRSSSCSRSPRGSTLPFFRHAGILKRVIERVHRIRIQTQQRSVLSNMGYCEMVFLRCSVMT